MPIVWKTNNMFPYRVFPLIKIFNFGSSLTKMSHLQTILGANGIIAQELSKYLPGHIKQVRQVSRNPKKVNESDEIRQADLLNYNQTEKAIEGSEVVYLQIGRAH